MTKYKKSLKDSLIFWVQFERMIAFFIDLMIILLPFYLYYTTTGEGSDLLVYLYFLAFFVYSTWMEYRFGRTIGKFIFRLKVLTEDFKKPTIIQIIIRNVTKFVDMFISPFSFISQHTLYNSSKKQRVGDMLAHTIVVRI